MIPRWMLLTGAWGAGVLLVLHGGASWVQHGLMPSGVITMAEGLGRTAVLWHLLFRDPWWLIGGILFLAAAWYCRRMTSPARTGEQSDLTSTLDLRTGR